MHKIIVPKISRSCMIMHLRTLWKNAESQGCIQDFETIGMKQGWAICIFANSFCSQIKLRLFNSSKRNTALVQTNHLKNRNFVSFSFLQELCFLYQHAQLLILSHSSAQLVLKIWIQLAFKWCQLTYVLASNFWVTFISSKVFINIQQQ